MQAEGKFDQLTGAKGQYGHVVLEIEPLERGKGFEFAQKLIRTSFPSCILVRLNEVSTTVWIPGR